MWITESDHQEVVDENIALHASLKTLREGVSETVGLLNDSVGPEGQLSEEVRVEAVSMLEGLHQKSNH